ncbi:T-complex protein 1 subunit theta-like [Pelodytes ibericus]
MAAHVPTPPTIHQFQRPGTRVFSGMEECAIKHASAVIHLARCLRSCYGPAGTNKLIITRLGHTLISSSARSILPELEIEHPAAMLARQACQTQAQECGDGTNTVMQLTAALMVEAEILLRRGVEACDLCLGYRLACDHACRNLKFLCFYPWEEGSDEGSPLIRLRSNDVASIDGLPSSPHEDMSSGQTSMSKTLLLENESKSNLQPSVLKFVYGNMLHYSLASTAPNALLSSLLRGTLLDSLVEWACSVPLTEETDTVEVLGVNGGTLEDSWSLKGAIIPTESLGTKRRVENSRLAVYVCPFGEQKTRTTCTTLVQKAEELMELQFWKERVEEARIEAIRQAGVTTLAVAGAVSELALHYCNRAGIMVVKLERRSEARQLVLATGARALTTDRAPEEEELGRCHRVYPTEIGGLPMMAFESCPGAGKGLVTVVVKGSTPELVSTAKEAVKTAVHFFNALREEPRMVLGAGATETYLSVQLEKLGLGFPKLKQNGILAYSRALESLPRALASNWGLDEAKVMGDLRVSHYMGEAGIGVGENGAGPTTVLDSVLVKRRALQLATDVAVTLICCGEVVVAKKSGGPQFRKENPNWDLEPDLVE